MRKTRCSDWSVLPGRFCGCNRRQEDPAEARLGVPPCSAVRDLPGSPDDAVCRFPDAPDACRAAVAGHRASTASPGPGGHGRANPHTTAAQPFRPGPIPYPCRPRPIRRPRRRSSACRPPRRQPQLPHASSYPHRNNWASPVRPALRPVPLSPTASIGTLSALASIASEPWVSTWTSSATVHSVWRSCCPPANRTEPTPSRRPPTVKQRPWPSPWSGPKVGRGCENDRGSLSVVRGPWSVVSCQLIVPVG